MTVQSTPPQAPDWNIFWSRGQARRFTQISWSKRRIIQLLLPYVVNNKIALDAGCGSGFFSGFFLDQGMKTLSLDYSQEALSIAEVITGGRSRLLKADLLKDSLMSIIQEPVDLIFTDGLFEHFSSEQQDAIMRNLVSVLGEKGIIVTVVPNKFSPWELIRPLYMPGIDEEPFTLQQLLELNLRNELRILSKGGINTLPFRCSPDRLLGGWFGMLLYTISTR